MKSITNKIYEGFFSNVGGSLSYFKKLLVPIFELNNPNRKNTPDRNDIDDILTKLPEKFGFNIYKYNGSQTEIIKSIKVTKEEDDLFWVVEGSSHAHCDTEITTLNIHPFYFAKNPLKVVMTYDGEEVK